MSYNRKRKKTDGGVFNFEGAISRHLDRMSLSISSPSGFGNNSIMKAVTLRLQLVFLESILTPFLTEEYVEKRKAVSFESVKIAGNPEGFLNYYEKIDELLKLLIQIAANNQVIKSDVTDTSLLDLSEDEEED